MSNAILILNAGSSSIKFACYEELGQIDKPFLQGSIDGIARAPVFTAIAADGTSPPPEHLQTISPTATHEDIITRLLEWLDDHIGAASVSAVGHRVVHGGEHFSQPVLVDAHVQQQLEALVSLAPLHQPHNLAAIDAVRQWNSALVQIACFDTAFHRQQPRLAQLFALPRHLSDKGILRYGFHGLSYEYIASQLPKHLPEQCDGRVVVAHLGNGASLCAIKQRRCVASTMGFTALHGLMMGRRCGTLDAGVVLHLLQQHNMSIEAVQELLYKESGLLGVSGISNNMQSLEHSDSPDAREAIELFCYMAAGEIGRLAVALQGLDAIVFTAGIGEHSALVRQLICDQLAWLGVALNDDGNQSGGARISAESSAVQVQVIPTDEQVVIAKAVRHVTGMNTAQNAIQQ